jgi:hypothetical protein
MARADHVEAQLGGEPVADLGAGRRVLPAPVTTCLLRLRTRALRAAFDHLLGAAGDRSDRHNRHRGDRPLLPSFRSDAYGSASRSADHVATS